jgi:cytidylate kinase
VAEKRSLGGRNIAISGLTAAGKTTHSQILADRLGYEYVSAGEMLLALTEIAFDDPQHAWFGHNTEIETARASGNIDSAVDQTLVHLADTRRGQVFDAWALPWIYRGDLTRIWIDSDRSSRHWKCFVSQGASPPLDLAGCGHLVDAKDDYTRRSFLARHRFDLYRDHHVFDAVLSNTHLISAPTRESADHGIRHFVPVLDRIVDYLLAGNPIDLARILLEPESAESQCAMYVRGLEVPGRSSYSISCDGIP